MNRKKLFILVLVCALIVCCFCCKTDEEKAARQAQANWNQASNEQRVSIYCALIKEYMLLQGDLGKNTPYPAMKRSVKGGMMTSGLTQTEAIAQAEEYLIVEQAVFWRAEQDGIVVTDDEVKEYILKNVISRMVKEPDYNMVNSACEKEGITFEDTVWAYESSYKVDLIGERAGIDNYDDLETYKEESVVRFKASADYEPYKKILENCADLIRNNVTDKKALKEADIYYE